MGRSDRARMSIENRAKQFMPFAALKGYDEALRARERVVVEKSQLSEERLSELDEFVKGLMIGDMIRVVYYEREEYLSLCGLVSKIDREARYIRIVNTKVNFDDIYELTYMV